MRASPSVGSFLPAPRTTGEAFEYDSVDGEDDDDFDQSPTHQPVEIACVVPECGAVTRTLVALEDLDQRQRTPAGQHRVAETGEDVGRHRGKHHPAEESCRRDPVC